MDTTVNGLPKNARLLIGFKTPREPPVYDDHSIYAVIGKDIQLYEKIRSEWGDFETISKITLADLERTLLSPASICHRDKISFISDLKRLYVDCRAL